MIAVAIWAGDAVAQESIAGLIEHAPGIELVGMAEDELALARLLDAVRVDVVVLTSDAIATRDFVKGLAEEVAVIALVTESAAAMAALRAGAHGVLLHPAERREITAAIHAVAAGLSVLPAGLVDHILRPGNDRPASDTETLTPRELEVLALIAAGASNKLIARRLGISVHTAKFHVAGILEKLDAHSRAEAAIIAARLGLVLL